jgi:hypothetical protein
MFPCFRGDRSFSPSASRCVFETFLKIHLVGEKCFASFRVPPRGGTAKHGNVIGRSAKKVERNFKIPVDQPRTPPKVLVPQRKRDR